MFTFHKWLRKSNCSAVSISSQCGELCHHTYAFQPQWLSVWFLVILFDLVLTWGHRWRHPESVCVCVGSRGERHLHVGFVCMCLYVRVCVLCVCVEEESSQSPVPTEPLKALCAGGRWEEGSLSALGWKPGWVEGVWKWVSKAGPLQRKSKTHQTCLWETIVLLNRKGGIQICEIMTYQKYSFAKKWLWKTNTIKQQKHLLVVFCRMLGSTIVSSCSKFFMDYNF